MNFISATRHSPKQRLALLLCEKSTVGADIDQLYRQIISTSENPLLHCWMLAYIIHLFHPLPLAELQVLFHEDQDTLAVTLEVFSPVILNPPDGLGTVEIYHTSLRDFIMDPQRSKDYHMDYAHIHEHLTICCLRVLIGKAVNEGPSYSYVSYAILWSLHLSRAYPSRKLRKLLALFTKGTSFTSDRLYLVDIARETCLSLKWIRSLSDIATAWRIVKASRRADNALKAARIRSIEEGVSETNNMP